MSSRILAGLFLAMALLAGRAAPALAQTGEAAFTLRMADRFRAAYPGRNVQVSGPLMLKVASPLGDADVSVGRIYNFCASSTAEECEDSIVRFVTVVGESLVEQPPVVREQLRVAVRHTDFCEELDRMARSGPEEAATLHRPIAPLLCVVLMADYPTSMRGVALRDLQPLDLDAAAGWALGERQTLAELPRPDALEGLGSSLVAVTEYDYVTSLLLDTEGWRRAAAANGGDLIVALPSDAFLIAGRLANLGDVAGFKAVTRENFETAERGITPLVYRWTDAGWVPLD